MANAGGRPLWVTLCMADAWIRAIKTFFWLCLCVCARAFISPYSLMTTPSFTCWNMAMCCTRTDFLCQGRRIIRWYLCRDVISLLCKKPGILMLRRFWRNNGAEAIHHWTAGSPGVWLQSRGSIYWDVLTSDCMWMREKLLLLPRGEKKKKKKSPQCASSLGQHTRSQPPPPPLLPWIPVFAHFAWLLSWQRSAGGQVQSGRWSNAIRVTPERGSCANPYPRIAPRGSGNRAAAAAWLARWASASRAASTPADVAPGWAVSISPARRNLCRLCWREGASVQTPPTDDSPPDPHLRSMSCQVMLARPFSSCVLCASLRSPF